jgi:hypothetical protein
LITASESDCIFLSFASKVKIPAVFPRPAVKYMNKYRLKTLKGSCIKPFYTDQCWVLTYIFLLIVHKGKKNVCFNHNRNNKHAKWRNLTFQGKENLFIGRQFVIKLTIRGFFSHLRS